MLIDKLLKRLQTLEDMALTMGDLDTAIKLNWLRNSIKFDGLDYDTACYKMQAITV